MKKLILSLFFLSLSCNGDILENFANTAFEEVTGSALSAEGVAESIGACYKLKKINGIDPGFCGIFGLDISTSFDYCSALPPMPGLEKLSREERFGVNTNALKNACTGLVDSINRDIDDINSIPSLDKAASWYNEFSGDNNFNNGKPKSWFFEKYLNTETLVKNPDSLVSKVIFSGTKKDKSMANFIIDQAKIKINARHSVEDEERITNITIDDIKKTIPKDMNDYKIKVQEMAGIISDGSEDETFSAIADTLDDILSEYTEDSMEHLKAEQDAGLFLKKLEEKVENSRRVMLGINKDPNRLPIPTKEMAKYYMDGSIPTFAKEVREQMLKEAKLKAIADKFKNEKIAKYKLIVKKSLINKKKFDKAKIENEIDAIVDGI